RVHAVLAHFVARRGHDATVAGPADDHRFAAQLRMIELLHGCVERIHVDVQDGAGVHFTVIVITFDMTGGSCGMCSWSPRMSCRVCLPGSSSSVVSVLPLPKCRLFASAGIGASSGGVSASTIR